MEEAFFHGVLESHNDDSAARLLLAEWLGDRGDPRAAGYHYMAIALKHPYRSYATWEWWSIESANEEQIRLPNRLWLPLPTRPAAGYPRCKEWSSRRAAEEALCLLMNAGPRLQTSSR